MAASDDGRKSPPDTGGEFVSGFAPGSGPDGVTGTGGDGKATDDRWEVDVGGIGVLAVTVREGGSEERGEEAMVELDEEKGFGGTTVVEVEGAEEVGSACMEKDVGNVEVDSGNREIEEEEVSGAESKVEDESGGGEEGGQLILGNRADVLGGTIAIDVEWEDEGARVEGGVNEGHFTVEKILDGGREKAQECEKQGVKGEERGGEGNDEWNVKGEEVGQVRPNMPDCPHGSLTGKCINGEGLSNGLEGIHGVCVDREKDEENLVGEEDLADVKRLDEAEKRVGGGWEEECQVSLCFEDCGVIGEERPCKGKNGWDGREGDSGHEAHARSGPDSYHQRPNKTNCAYYVMTGKCVNGEGCKFNHPSGNQNQNDCKPSTSVENEEDKSECEYLCSRKDILVSLCDYGTGESKDRREQCPDNAKVRRESWNDKCISNQDKVPDLYSSWSSNQPDCLYYFTAGKCSYGDQCRFKHVKKQIYCAKVPKKEDGHEGENGVTKDGWECNQNGSDCDVSGDKVEDGWGEATYGDCKVEYGRKEWTKDEWVKDEGWSVNEDKKEDYSYYPQRAHVADCAYYLKTGKCAYGQNCKFNHPFTGRQNQHARPKNEPMKQAMAMEGKWDLDSNPKRKEYRNQGIIGKGDGWEDGREERKVEWVKEFRDKEQRQMGKEAQRWSSYEYPQRPNEPDCAYYLHTGKCAFGSNCKFNHPSSRLQIHCNLAPPGDKLGNSYRNARSKDYQGKTETDAYLLNSIGLPLRPGERECSYYVQNGTCKFTVNCCFHHPEPDIARGDRPLMVRKGGSPYFNEYQISKSASPHKNDSNCPNFMETGYCKFRSTCRFRHPPQGGREDCLLSPIGLPLRPGKLICTYYSQKGVCKFGPACEYDHPMERISLRRGY